MKFGLTDSASDLFAIAMGLFTSADLSIFHEFEPPPTGGGHQFLRALWKQAKVKGLRVENNAISRTTRACLFNSFNFRTSRLERLRRRGVLYIHRVDGPVDVYRGQNEGVDQHIYSVNQKFADKTIFQSRYSMEKHTELGMEFKNPTVIMNAADPEIFHSRGRIEFSQNRKTRLIASSWSDNVNKGAAVYQWLDEHLDWASFEMTFVGRSTVTFKNIRMMPAVDSFRMAELFRQYDIYLTASRNDPCSNSLIEALTCGMPAVYLKSGGHPEIVGGAGAEFDEAEEIPELLEQVIGQYEAFQSRISIPSIQDISEQYLKVLELI
ncbi:MAG: glycosyltransferase family 4 protein [Anaerolineales bacterium]|nr:glycosyltransferase family 4 protein [Anaerolineales bacterium]